MQVTLTMRDPCKPQTPYVVTMQRREVVTLCPLPPPQQETTAAAAVRAAAEGGGVGGARAAAATGPRERERDGYSLYLLYWYKRPTTDAEGAAARCEPSEPRSPGLSFVTGRTALARDLLGPR
jgi:hypothetical protein